MLGTRTDLGTRIELGTSMAAIMGLVWEAVRREIGHPLTPVDYGERTCRHRVTSAFSAADHPSSPDRAKSRRVIQFPENEIRVGEGTCRGRKLSRNEISRNEMAEADAGRLIRRL